MSMRSVEFRISYLLSPISALALLSLTASGEPAPVRLMTLDPGHFHAALVQKFMYPDVDPVVEVYAPAGPDLDAHLKLVTGFNARTNDPTRWEIKTHTGAGFADQLFAEKPGNVVVLAGNNAKRPTISCARWRTA